jgi:hypothetical protein
MNTGDAPPFSAVELVDVAKPVCPYPGLRPFRDNEANLFFGREQEIARTLEMLEKQQLVVVHGASGCGKSSVVRAGVIPVFRMDALAMDRKMVSVTIMPGDVAGPLGALARELDNALVPAGVDGATDPILGNSWLGVLAISGDWQRDIGAAAKKANVVLCLLIDQFEEIFAAARNGFDVEADSLVAFLTGLGESAKPGTGLGERDISVILTMRSDYIGECARWDNFAETVNRCQYLLPRITTFGALSAIHEPARRNGALISDRVADRLLNVIANERDGLPVLQHALMRAWQRGNMRDGVFTVDVAALDDVGGAENALSLHADELFAKLVLENPELGETIDWMFRSLSELDSDRRIIRRPCSLTRLVTETGAAEADVRKVVETFRHPENSLLSPHPPKPLTSESPIAVSHEALLRHWTRVKDTGVNLDGEPRGLVYQELKDRDIWNSLVVRANEFRQNPKAILGPATTEQRWVWYQNIISRQGWTDRYASKDKFIQSTEDRRWQNVEALMVASHKNSETKSRYYQYFKRASVLFSVLTIIFITASAFMWISVLSWDNWSKFAKDVKNPVVIERSAFNRYIKNTQDLTILQMALEYCSEAPSTDCVIRQRQKFERLSQSRLGDGGGIGPIPNGGKQ